MKTNVICIVIDSLGSEFYEKMPNKENLFLEKLRGKGLFADNVFAQAPYTEGAVMGLQCGQRVLDYNGYYRRLAETPKTVFEAFKDHGYRTFSNTVQPHMYAESLTRGMTDPFFNVAPDFTAVEVYRLDYFRGFFDSENLCFTEEDIEREVVRLFQDYFQSALAFVRSILQEKPITSLIAKHFSKTALQEMGDFLENQKALFDQDTKAFVADYFSKKPKTHPLYLRPIPGLGHKMSDPETRTAIRPILEEAVRFEEKVYRKANKKNPLDWAGLRKGFFRFIKKPAPKTFKSFLRLGYFNLMGRRYLGAKEWKKGGFDQMKAAPSLRTHLDHFLNWKRGVSDPYFAYIHVDDIHGNSTWISYDSNDYSLVASEISEAKAFFQKCKGKCVGNINYLAGINYVDGVLRSFYEQLVEDGSAENTVLVVTADHGYSQFQSPIRSDPINTFHPECYRTPVWIVGPGYTPKEIHGFRQSFSFPNTLLSCAGLSQDPAFFGRAFDKGEDEPYIVQEFMGGGCPDIKRRPILLCVRNLDYSITVSAFICADQLKPSDITEIYDLKKDPNETNNLAPLAKMNDALTKLFGVLEGRFQEVKTQNE